DDCYLIADDGWKAETYRVLVKNKKGNEVDKGWACDLVPKDLVLNRYFAAEQEAIRSQQTALETLEARLAELEEEHGADDGALNNVSSKAEALDAWHETLISVWQSFDVSKYRQYMQALTTQETALQRLLDLQTDPRLQALANAKGKLTQATVKARRR